MQAKRLVFSAIKKVEWETFTLPDTVAPFEIRVEAEYSLISPGTELAIFTGSHIGFTMEKPPFPLIPSNPGYALVGRVVEAGKEVEAGYKGKRVLVEAPHGTHAVVEIKRNPPILLPETLDPKVAPLIRMAKIGITALRLAPPQLGEGVLMFGLGLVGLLCAQLYRLSGAKPVGGTDRIPSRLELAKKFGLLPLPGIDPTQKDAYLEKVKRVFGDGGPKIVIEATGSPSMVPLALEVCSIGGRVVLLGSTRGKVDLDVYSLIHRKGISLIGAHERLQDFSPPSSPVWNRAANQTLLAELFSQGDIQTQGLISHQVPVREVLDIYPSMAKTPEAYLGVLIEWKEG